MSRTQKEKNAEQNTKAFGCLLFVVIALGFAGCNAVFGDDDEPVKKRPAAAASSTPTPTPAPDKAATSACSYSVAADLARGVKRTQRATALAARAVGFSVKSKVLRGLKGSKLKSWCGLHLPDVNEHTLDDYLPSFQKEHDSITTESLLNSGGSGSGGSGGGRKHKGRW